jgi:hypothetical protein
LKRFKTSASKEPTTINFLDEITIGLTLNPVGETNHRRSDPLIEKNQKGLDDLIMDALARFREDISFSDEEEEYEDENSAWSDDE